MVFGRFFAGIATGVIIPMVVHENVHYAIATSFLEPHLKYQYVKEKRGPHLAIPVHELDTYIKNVVMGCGLFFIIIGPTLYQTYYKGVNILGENVEAVMDDKLSEELVQSDDSYVTILRNIKNSQAKRN